MQRWTWGAYMMRAPWPRLRTEGRVTASLDLRCYDKIPQAGWLIRKRNLFLTLVQDGIWRSVCTFLGCRLLIVLTWWKELLWQHESHSQGLCLHDLVTLKSLSPNTVTLGTRFSTYGFGGKTNIQTIAGRKGLQVNTGMATSGSEHCSKGCFQTQKYLTTKVMLHSEYVHISRHLMYRSNVEHWKGPNEMEHVTNEGRRRCA